MAVEEEVAKLVSALRELQKSVVESYPADNEIKDIVGSLAPPLGKAEISKIAGGLVDRFKNVDTTVVNPKWSSKGPIANINYIKANILPNLWNGNWMSAYVAYDAVLRQIEASFEFAFRQPVNWESAEARKLMPPELAKRIRSLAAQVSATENKSSALDQQVSTINDAYDAALNLPTDLAALEEARAQTISWREDAQRDAILAAESLKTINANVEEAERLRDEAKKLVSDTADAYSAATTRGLGQAFQERALNTAKSMWVWVVGLIAALVSGAVVGAIRVSALERLISANATSSSISLSVTLAIISVAAPVWFAWIATKQIGQRFRLSEDYAFKASVARAYEGYRREAARLDPDFAARLFKTALDRLEEEPLRYVEHEVHGSPWHEALVRRRSQTGKAVAAAKMSAPDDISGKVPPQGGVSTLEERPPAVDA